MGVDMKFAVMTLSGLLALPLVAPAACAADTKAATPAAAPAKTDATATLEQRANEAMNRGQFSLAKDLFTKVADRIKDTDKKRYAAIQEQIRACEASIKQLAAPNPLPPTNLTEPAVETAPEKRKKHVAPANGQPYVISMKELGNFEYDADKGGNIPDDVKKLTGTKVRVQGFMIPLDQADNISHFSLVPSLFACCFGQPPQIQHQIVVHTPKGKAVGYYPDEIVCEGTLKVDEKKDDGYIVSVFEMDVQSVKPAAK
jgi:hypothetical protein